MSVSPVGNRGMLSEEAERNGLMAKGAGGGGQIYMIALIFAIIVICGLMGLIYHFSQEVEEITKKHVSAQKKYEDERDKTKDAIRERDEWRRLISGSPQPLDPNNYTNVMDEAAAKLEEILKPNWVQDAQFSEDIQRLNIKKKGKYDSIGELHKDLLNELQAVIHVIPRLQREREKARKEAENIRKEKDQIRTKKDEEIRKLRNELTREQDKALEQARQFDAEKKRLTDEIARLQAEKNKVIQDFKIREARLDSEITRLQQRIEEIIKKEKKSFAEASTADGEILFTEERTGYAWIDIGKKHGLRRGTRFETFQFIKGGRQKLKGMVEVKTVEEEISQVAILDIPVKVTNPATEETYLVQPDPFDPIVKGDLIRSPLFDAEEVPTFVFLGSKLSGKLYDLPELQRKIEEFGGNVDRNVTIDTDFVVALEGAEEENPDEFRNAVQFGVIFLREEELLDFVGR